MAVNIVILTDSRNMKNYEMPFHVTPYIYVGEWVENLIVTHDDQSKNTMNENRKRFEHLLLSQTI